MTDKRNNKTKAWELYELGRSYNNSLTPNQYNLVETNTEFFIGNQWLHLPETPAMRRLPKPVFNILKRVASLFIASLTSAGTAIRFEPLAYYDGSNIADPQHDAARFANAAVDNLLEKMKFEYRIRDALYDGARTGDYCAHVYFDPDAKPYGGAFSAHTGEIKMELVEGINVMFGNPNTHDVQSQPYVLLVGRDTVENLRNEAKRFQRNRKLYNSSTTPHEDESMIDASIQADAANQWMTGVGGKTELVPTDETGKALYVILYTKVQTEVEKTDENGEPVYEDVLDKDGNVVYEDELYGGRQLPKRQKVKELVTTVHVTKATMTSVIYEDVDTGLSLYPIAWGNWEHQVNQYHGRALVTGMLPNQIFINTMFATAMKHMQSLALPKTVYNADLLPSWSNEAGQAIGVRNLPPGQSVTGVAYNLQPADMSNQIFALIDKAVALTKDCLGATDAQLGTARPDNTSALMVLQTNSEVPLENVAARKNEWVEDLGAVLLDMMGTYYGKRPIVVDREFEEPSVGSGGTPTIDPRTGMMSVQKITRKVVEEFDFSQLKHLWLNIKVDVGATTYFSEIAMTQTLDNLRRDGTLDVIQYLERLPDKLIPRKQELIDQLMGRIAEGEQANAAAGAAIPEPGSPVSQPAPSTGKGGPSMGGPIDSSVALQGLPPGAEAMYGNLPEPAQRMARTQGALRMT